MSRSCSSNPTGPSGSIALDLADAQLYPLLYAHLDDRAIYRNAMAYSMLARHFNDWYGNHRKWLTALLKAWTTDPQHGESNIKILSDIASRWYPQVSEAVQTFAQGVAESAGSTTIMSGCDRAAAESAAELAKFGIHVPAGQEATA